jgi:hypothetical protein
MQSIYATIETRSRLEQCPGVRMTWAIENFTNRGLFDDASGIHDGDIVAHVCDNAEIMSDEQKREIEFLPQSLQQIQILQLNGRVERRRCLIGD